jgi:hypothetical protein
MHAASSAIKERLLAKLWFLLDQQDLFKVGAIALEALSENDGRQCRERCDESACQLPISLRLSLSRILPMKRAVWRAPGAASR